VFAANHEPFSCSTTITSIAPLNVAGLNEPRDQDCAHG
jgi:hypothetical protein